MTVEDVDGLDIDPVGGCRAIMKATLVGMVVVVLVLLIALGLLLFLTGNTMQ